MTNTTSVPSRLAQKLGDGVVALQLRCDRYDKFIDLLVAQYGDANVDFTVGGFAIVSDHANNLDELVAGQATGLALVSIARVPTDVETELWLVASGVEVPDWATTQS